MSSPSYESVYAAYKQAGQEHVFQFYDDLPSSEQATLLSQLASIDPSYVNEIYKLALTADAAPTSGIAISPPPAEAVDTPIDNPEKEAKWRETGFSAIKAGKVAVILLAGGQGTRLGSSDPKGCYDIGLPSNKSLFQLQAERIKKLQSLAAGDAVIPWYIMTSGPTRKATEAFFQKNNFWGLSTANVVFFDQGVLPCLTNEGKILLDTKSKVAVAPDGNGGIYAALRSTKTTSLGNVSVLADMRQRGISDIYCYCVDNCLARVADPVFLGYCIGTGARCGTKVVKKAYASESVGVVALKADKWNVIEYSEISKELSEASDPAKAGELLFRAANIANHYYTLDFLDSVASFSSAMAFHIARKKIPHVNLQSGETVKPSKPNGMKLEQFIFDVLPFLPLNQHAMLEVERKEEFSPLKNAPGTGTDDPQTSRRDLLEQQRRWLQAAGANVPEGIEVELSPLVTYFGEGLEHFKGKTFAKSGKADSLEEVTALLS